MDHLEAESRIGPGYPTLLCTSGYLSQPARRLLDLLAASNGSSILWYSGDFDPKGLEIASTILNRYPGRSRPWRLDVTTDEQCARRGLPTDEDRLRGLDRVTHWFPELANTMRRHHVLVYQEALVDQLLYDIGGDGHVDIGGDGHVASRS